MCLDIVVFVNFYVWFVYMVILSISKVRVDEVWFVVFGLLN